MGRVSRYIKAVQQAAEDRTSLRDTKKLGIASLLEGKARTPAKTPKAPPPERRAAVRRVCRRPVVSQPRVRPGDLWDAQLADLSTHGVGLLLDRRCRTGTVLQIDLPLPEFQRSLLARVHYVKQQDNGYLHGCELLTQLSPAELQLLLS